MTVGRWIPITLQLVSWSGWAKSEDYPKSPPSDYKSKLLLQGFPRAALEESESPAGFQLLGTWLALQGNEVTRNGQCQGLREEVQPEQPKPSNRLRLNANVSPSQAHGGRGGDPHIFAFRACCDSLCCGCVHSLGNLSVNRATTC